MESFLLSLKQSIYNWGYYVDFTKLSKVDTYIGQLKLIEKLFKCNTENIDKYVLELVSDIKNRQAFLLLLALKKAQLKDAIVTSNCDDSEYNYFEIFNKKSNLTKEEKRYFMIFFYESGLREFFLNTKIKSLIDYCRGIAIGLDTNGRKNRTGLLMEDVCDKIISDICIRNNWLYLKQANSKSIYENWGIDIDIGKINRRFDFVINVNNRLHIIEVNYYNSNGSKIKATAKEYIILNKLLNNNNFNFYWVTDGKAWNQNTSILSEIPDDLYFMNLSQISNGEFEGILQNKIRKFIA